MTAIYSIGTAVPEHQLKQQKAKELIEGLIDDRKLSRYLAVFDNANIDQRYFVAEPAWFLSEHGLAERNNLFFSKGIQLAINAINDCLKNCDIHLDEIDAVISVSSTAILTPPIEVHLLNRLPFRKDIKRYPFFGLGCAGGGIALSRAHDYLQSNPDQAVMIINLELASVAFHHDQLDSQNIVGAALFGDGASCTVLLGKDHQKLNSSNKHLHIVSTSSRILDDSIDVMGWNVKDDGFHVIFATVIPKIVKTFWRAHLNDFINNIGINFSEIENVLAHPGGRKVLEEIEALMEEHQSLKFSKYILKTYGNMSSPTILFVIKEALKDEGVFNQKYHLASALGPGFASEILLMEWK
ncbi:type III polyketide synthase [Filobacillus milosensis]|uniref:Type III polyketide synthase n=1 Tax=Filobacillus milosensis TaxID=94137 RepID=A0A4Y8IXB1_9BACI|nr:type III polyketide synthase [Filobacillus milosensis]TFB24005.1 type III polyketide synthase [Filobacillus milosensis]